MSTAHRTLLRRTRRRTLHYALAPALLSLVVSPLGAQRCLGVAGFAARPMRVDGVLTAGGHRTALAADLAFGQPAGTFGSVGLGVLDYDGSNSSALLVSGSIGTQVQVGTPSRESPGAQLCPVASVEGRFGPNVGDVDQSGVTLKGGVSLGSSFPMTPTARLLPFGTVSFGYARASVSTRSTTLTSDDVGGFVDLGAGFVFDDRFTVRPSVSIPVGFAGADARFGVLVGFSFGSR